MLQTSNKANICRGKLCGRLNLICGVINIRTQVTRPCKDVREIPYDLMRV